jgi:uncharacterized protein involved in type VI secretion and phage assembly
MSSGYHQLRANVGSLAQMAAHGFAPPRLGLVSSYDPEAYAVKVRVMPEDTETGWLPILSMMAGDAFGAYFGPSLGDQALVVYQEGDVTTGVCLGFLGSDEDPPPTVEPGEIHLIAKEGDASAVFKPDGTITSKGTWTHEGTFHATGAVTSEADVIDHSDGSSGVSMKEHRDAYNDHRHTGVQAGGATSGTTTVPAT